jgi:predicted MFS family arabinose efflux permease
MENQFSVGLQWLLGAACGLLIANLYYGQPLNGLIGAALGMPPQSSGLIITFPLAGYGLGLLLIVPLADLIENRWLVLLLVALESLWVLLAGLSPNAPLFLSAALLMGVSASAVQILVPYVTYLAPEAARGQAVGKVVSGVMLGIMLARPVSSFVADWWSWQAIFQISAVLMAGLFLMLRLALPPRKPTHSLTYGKLLRSMGQIFVTTEVLRRRALYHACMFGAFSVFWTAAPLYLAGPRFELTQRGVAWVALAGVACAVAPPIAGRVADSGHGGWGTALAMLLATGAFLLSDSGRAGSRLGLALVVACAILLDFAVSSNLVFGQRAIYSLAAEQRSRINGLFMTTFFSGGAVSSALSGWCYSRYGWGGVSALGIALPLAGLLYFASERQESKAPPLK